MLARKKKGPKRMQGRYIKETISSPDIVAIHTCVDGYPHAMDESLSEITIFNVNGNVQKIELDPAMWYHNVWIEDSSVYAEACPWGSVSKFNTHSQTQCIYQKFI